MNGNDELAALRREFPAWYIVRIFGGYRASPKGMPVVEAVYIDSMREKLAHVEWEWASDNNARVARRDATS